MTRSESLRILLLEQGEGKEEDSQGGIHSPDGKTSTQEKRVSPETGSQE